MKKIKSFIGKNYKIIVAFILGITISVVGVYAETIFKSSDVIYDNSSSGLTSTNLQGAIDELNTKADAKIEEAKASFPDGYICNYASGAAVSTKNSNISAVYTYNPTTCVTGEEETCKESSCANYSNAGSCGAGTIIKYKVNDTEEKYFHVLHDDGETITVQQRENTTDNAAWYSSSADNSKGPTTVLSVLESATSGWSNIEDQTYTMGTTSFGTGNNAYTGCTKGGCTTNTYTLDSRTAKARMITMQEATALGCTTSTKQSCPNFMNNYLYNSTSNGGTVNDNTDSTGTNRYGYWTMSAYSSSSSRAWFVSFTGYVDYSSNTNTNYGARAVVVVSK